MSTNWKGMQAFGCRKPTEFEVPKGVKPRYMTMGSWHANLRKDGAMRNPRYSKSSWKGG